MFIPHQVLHVNSFNLHYPLMRSGLSQSLFTNEKTEAQRDAGSPT